MVLFVEGYIYYRHEMMRERLQYIDVVEAYATALRKSNGDVVEQARSKGVNCSDAL